jgi:Na+-driven multidrug efflux pump
MIVLALTQMLGVGTTTLISHAAGRNVRPVYRMKRAKETVTPPLY